MRPHWLKSQGIENGVRVRVGTTNRRADGPLSAEMRRSALNLSYDEEPMPDVNPEALDFRVASGLFAGLRDWNENTPETLRLTRIGRIVMVGESAYDSKKQYLTTKEAEA